MKQWYVLNKLGLWFNYNSLGGDLGELAASGKESSLTARNAELDFWRSFWGGGFEEGGMGQSWWLQSNKHFPFGGYMVYYK